MAALGSVVLVHGFLSVLGLYYLAGKLKKRGYGILAPALPTTVQSVRKCSDALARMIEKDFSKEGTVHFVGFSMGGLIIRDYLSQHVVEELGRIVLIGTPNRGSPYANLLLEVPFSRQVLKSLPDLAEPGPDIAPPLNVPPPEVGVIMGTQPDPVRKRLMPGEHDGLVSAESVRCVPTTDEVTIPCSHEFLPWRADTAEAVASFLETGKFSRTQL